MDVIIDIQCLKNDKNVAVPKEVAILSIDGNYFGHWLVSPSADINKFPKEIRQQNDWLKRHHHGLDYFEGEVSLKFLYKTLKDITKKVNRVFVRGKEKWSIIHKLTAREVINLEYDTDCPSFHNLPWSDTYCIQHSIKVLHLHFNCALNNVHRLRCWLQKQEKYQQISDFLTIQLPDNFYDEHPRNLEEAVENTLAYSGCIPSRSDPQGVDETDSIRS